MDLRRRKNVRSAVQGVVKSVQIRYVQTPNTCKPQNNKATAQVAKSQFIIIISGTYASSRL